MTPKDVRHMLNEPKPDRAIGFASRNGNPIFLGAIEDAWTDDEWAMYTRDGSVPPGRAVTIGMSVHVPITVERFDIPMGQSWDLNLGHDVIDHPYRRESRLFSPPVRIEPWQLWTIVVRNRMDEAKRFFGSAWGQ